MTKYLLLSERVGDEGIYERDIILEMKDGIVKESHITTDFRYPDEDILKGKSSEELEAFARGDKDKYWEVHELSEVQYRIEYEKNRIGRIRLNQKNKDVDLLALKEQKLDQAGRTRTRSGQPPKSKEEKRAAAYKKMLDEKYKSNS